MSQQTSINPSKTSPGSAMEMGLAALGEERQTLRHRLEEGATGGELLREFSDFMDRLLIARFREVLYDGKPSVRAGWQECCMVALGGYGRRELAPYSDIDVMVLTDGNHQALAQTLSKGVFHRLWDLGFQVGHSVRNLAECWRLAKADLTIYTSLLEARYVVGSPDVFQKFQRKFAAGRLFNRQAERFIIQKIHEREREYAKFGETVFLLEPNIKKSKGGLRDLHLLQWVAQVRYGIGTIHDLAGQGLIAFQDYQVLQEAREFLWRVRCWLHLDAGRAQDILTFDDQIRLAGRFGLRDLPHLMAVEQFMQQYYRHTAALFDRCRRFLDQTRKRSWWQRVRSSWPPALIEGKFRIVDDHLTIPSAYVPDLVNNPLSLIQLFVVSQERGVPVDTGILNELSEALSRIPNERFHTEQASKLFRRLLSRPGRVFNTLEAMHRAGLLEKLVPAFARVRGLMQFNQYHKYTVDEHSLFAVREAERLQEDPGLLGEVYRSIPDKDLLHLALLLHDLGKGRPGDHSEVGQEIAQKTGERLQLPNKDKQMLEFLVFHHLLMAHTAFRRDVGDPKIISTFGSVVKSVDGLRKLFLLTVADISAVGPEAMNKWKATLLAELYTQTYEHLVGTLEALGGEGSREAVRESVKSSLVQILKIGDQSSAWKGQDVAEWVEDFLNQISDAYLRDTPVAVMAGHCLAVRRVGENPVYVEGRYQEGTGISQFVLIARPREKPGIFMQATGVLAALNLQVLDAQVMTLADGTVFDVFSVHDPDYDGQPPAARFREVAGEMKAVVEGRHTVEELFAYRKRIRLRPRFPTGRRPTEVHIDNEVSDSFTVIEVFADDQQGLLYVLANTLVKLDLSTHMAKIGTRLDQVADIFYVTTAHGHKIPPGEATERIQQTIRDAVEAFVGEEE